MGRCRYCGLKHPSLIIEYGRVKAHYKVESNCPYFVKMTRASKKFSQRVKCKNHPMKYSHCGVRVWKYNMVNHFNPPHQDGELIDLELVIKIENYQPWLHVHILAHNWEVINNNNSCRPKNVSEEGIEALQKHVRQNRLLTAQFILYISQYYNFILFKMSNITWSLKKLPIKDSTNT